jgi:hypothetical protein
VHTHTHTYIHIHTHTHTHTSKNKAPELIRFKQSGIFKGQEEATKLFVSILPAQIVADASLATIRIAPYQAPRALRNQRPNGRVSARCFNVCKLERRPRRKAWERLYLYWRKELLRQMLAYTSCMYVCMYVRMYVC